MRISPMRAPPPYRASRGCTSARDLRCRRSALHGGARTTRSGSCSLPAPAGRRNWCSPRSRAFPRATVAHAFASTEAGVGFEVRDGLAGFPAALVGAPGAAVDIDVTGGTLRLRSAGNAMGYLGAHAPALKDSDGFIETGDRVELRDGRYVFIGRGGGVINVGGLKVYPEEVEAIINAQPGVRMSLVKARRSPITGAVVTAEVVLIEGAAAGAQAEELLKGEMLQACRRHLAAHKVPMSIRIVPALEVSASGKLVRPDA